MFTRYLLAILSLRSTGEHRVEVYVGERFESLKKLDELIREML
jgi:hypothetical protein